MPCAGAAHEFVAHACTLAPHDSRRCRVLRCSPRRSRAGTSRSTRRRRGARRAPCTRQHRSRSRSRALRGATGAHPPHATRTTVWGAASGGGGGDDAPRHDRAAAAAGASAAAAVRLRARTLWIRGRAMRSHDSPRRRWRSVTAKQRWVMAQRTVRTCFVIHRAGWAVAPQAASLQADGGVETLVGVRTAVRMM